MKTTLTALRRYAEAARWPPGYLEDLLAASTVDGETVEMDPKVHETLRAKHIRPDPAPEPTLAELASNFTTATARWAAAGFTVVNAADYAARSTACEACEFWDGAARLGLGKCGHAKCGCTRFKRWLATEKCPMGAW